MAYIDYVHIYHNKIVLLYILYHVTVNINNVILLISCGVNRKYNLDKNTTSAQRYTNLWGFPNVSERKAHVGSKNRYKSVWVE